MLGRFSAFLDYFHILHEPQAEENQDYYYENYYDQPVNSNEYYADEYNEYEDYVTEGDEYANDDVSNEDKFLNLIDVRLVILTCILSIFALLLYKRYRSEVKFLVEKIFSLEFRLGPKINVKRTQSGLEQAEHLCRKFEMIYQKDRKEETFNANEDKKNGQAKPFLFCGKNNWSELMFDFENIKGKFNSNSEVLGRLIFGRLACNGMPEADGAMPKQDYDARYENMERSFMRMKEAWENCEKFSAFLLLMATGHKPDLNSGKKEDKNG